MGRTRGRATNDRATAILVTDRDLQVLRDVVRFGALTVEHLTRRHFGSSQRAYARLSALATAGYLRHERVWYRGQGVYLVTPPGARLAAVGLPATGLAAARLAHHLAVADLADWLLGRYPGSQWITERELQRDSMTTVRDRGDGHLLGGVPHVPDGALISLDGQRTAVELELSTKKQDAYERIFRWYEGGLDYHRVWWFCATAALQDRVRDLVVRRRLDDIITIERLPAGLQATARTD